MVCGERKIAPRTKDLIECHCLWAIGSPDPLEKAAGPLFAKDSCLKPTMKFRLIICGMAKGFVDCLRTTFVVVRPIFFFKIFFFRITYLIIIKRDILQTIKFGAIIRKSPHLTPFDAENIQKSSLYKRQRAPFTNRSYID